MVSNSLFLDLMGPVSWSELQVTEALNGHEKANASVIIWNTRNRQWDIPCMKLKSCVNVLATRTKVWPIVGSSAWRWCLSILPFWVIGRTCSKWPGCWLGCKTPKQTNKWMNVGQKIPWTKDPRLVFTGWTKHPTEIWRGGQKIPYWFSTLDKTSHVYLSTWTKDPTMSKGLNSPQQEQTPLLIKGHFD